MTSYFFQMQVYSVKDPDHSLVFKTFHMTAWSTLVLKVLHMTASSTIVIEAFHTTAWSTLVIKEISSHQDILYD